MMAELKMVSKIVFMIFLIYLGKLTKAYFSVFLRLEQSCCVFNILGLGLSVIQSDLEFTESQDDVSSVLLWVIFLSTLILIVLTILRYVALMRWLIIRKEIN